MIFSLMTKVWATGFALFSMFFGAGNIVFPLIIGRMAQDETPFAILGLAFSAVAFPLLGLYAMMLYGGNIQTFLARIGKLPAMILLFLLQMSQGPAGSIPRLITLMHATVKIYLPISLFAFSVLICLYLYYLCKKRGKMIPFLGIVLTPALLLTLTVLVAAGFAWAPQATHADLGGLYYFGQGLKLGYQTTDLIAALLFATVILPHLESKKQMLQVSCIASMLLMVVYIGLCYVAACYGPLFPNAPAEELLQKIAIYVLGPYGAIFSSIAIFLACLTTAISLVVVFSDYLKVKGASIITLTVAAALANLGFSGIVKVWSPILDLLYPGLIILCLVNVYLAQDAHNRKQNESGISHL